MWALSISAPSRLPSQTPITLPHSPPKVSPALSWNTARPSSASFFFSSSATADSLPDAESVFSSSTSSAYIRSFLILSLLSRILVWF